MSKRRSRGEGTLFYWEEKKLWVGKVTLPDGKRKTKYGHTQEEVRSWLLEQRKALQGGYVQDDKITLSQFLDRYLQDYGGRSLRPSTFRSYQNMIRWHIQPELGEIKLAKLTPGHLNRLYTKKLDSGLSNRTVEYIHGILRRTLNKAVEWGVLSKNPTKTANPPKLVYKTPSIWTSIQVRAFLDVLAEDRWRGIYILACGTGMREGEILGLDVGSLNLVEGYLKVTQTLQFVQGKGLIFSEPKTLKSRRMIMLPGFVVEALRGHLQHREELSRSDTWQGSGLVFTTDIGTPISPRNLVRHFKTKLKQANLPDIRFHDLRHTTASLLLEKNVHPKIVQELLGHSTITLTLNTYSHIINPLGREAADTLDDLFK